MQRIEKRLRQSMGLDVESIGSSSLQRLVRLRMKAAGIATLDDYDRLLNLSATEWNQLVEAVVITETWFFRDREAFSALTEIIRAIWLPANSKAPLSILSLPCSTGEEPFSIAMALMDAGIPASRFAIDGVDLSERALEKAREGLYGKNSFRGRELSYRERHFQREGEGFALKQSIRDCVTFQQANLLNEGFTLGRSGYDFIFCRNLLIYFDRATQRQAFMKLNSLLAPGGTLFVGPAEMPLAMENGFASVNLPMAFACRRANSVPQLTRTKAFDRRVRPPTTEPASPPVTKARSAPSFLPQRDDLVTAMELADSGKLDEARQICQAHLQRSGASAQAYYLLGVIHDSQGQPAAREFYRKALYLDPDHYESLLQLALLVEKDGDVKAARNLRRRAQKRQPRL